MFVNNSMEHIVKFVVDNIFEMLKFVVEDTMLEAEVLVANHLNYFLRLIFKEFIQILCSILFECCICDDDDDDICC